MDAVWLILTESTLPQEALRKHLDSQPPRMEAGLMLERPVRGSGQRRLLDAGL